MRIRLMIIGLLVLAGRKLQAQMSVNGILYVNTYKALAMVEEQRAGIPAAIILAQGLHESEAGTSELVKQSNNHFGIKCKDDWKGQVVYHDDDSRQECFRSYATAADSYRDHSDFLRRSGRYSFLFDLDPADYEGWAYGLKKAGYATNIKYSQILIKLIKDYNLQQYSLIATGKMRPEDEVVLVAPGTTPGRSSAVAVVAPAVVGPAASGAALGSGVVSGDVVDSLAAVYPVEEFEINKTKVVYAKAGLSLLAIAGQYDIPLGRLLEFNDMKEQDVLEKGQLIFLQRKRRTGAVEYHLVKEGEGIYAICQAEGVRYQDLLEMNQLSPGLEPAAGERIYLQGSAPSRPRLAVNER
jgi:Mannosyl-glycoprotein endo-beta-N-acetylglucosaminidase/LysM domain